MKRTGALAVVATTLICGAIGAPSAVAATPPAYSKFSLPYPVDGPYPNDVVVDDARRLLLVSDYNDGFGATIVALDAASGSLRKQIHVGAFGSSQGSSDITSIAYDQRHAVLWVLASGAKDVSYDGTPPTQVAPPSLWKVDTTTLTASKVQDLTDYEPTELAVDDASGVLWLAGDRRVGASSAPFVGRLAVTSGTVTWGSLPEVPTALVADPSGTGVDALIPSGILAVHDDLAVSAPISLPHAPVAAVVNARSKQLLATDGGGKLYTVDVAARRVVRSVAIRPGVRALAFDPSRGVLHMTDVVDTASDSSYWYTRVTSVVAATGAVRGTVKIPGDQGDGGARIAVSPSLYRAYVVLDVIGVVRLSANRAVVRPKITGKPLLKQRLAATRGTWVDTPTSVRYQWLRDGRVISHATSSHHVVTRHDLGHRLSVRVTAVRGAEIGVRTSAATPRAARSSHA